MKGIALKAGAQPAECERKSVFIERLYRDIE